MHLQRHHLGGLLDRSFRILRKENLNAERGPRKLFWSTEYFGTSDDRLRLFAKGCTRAALRRMFEQLLYRIG